MYPHDKYQATTNPKLPGDVGRRGLANPSSCEFNGFSMSLTKTDDAIVPGTLFLDRINHTTLEIHRLKMAHAAFRPTDPTGRPNWSEK